MAYRTSVNNAVRPDWLQDPQRPHGSPLMWRWSNIGFCPDDITKITATPLIDSDGQTELWARLLPGAWFLMGIKTD